MAAQSHYETAFEFFLRSRKVPYLAVNDRRRPIVGGVNVKCFDFVVLPMKGRPLLCEVKGRKFPSRAGSDRRRYWEGWVPIEDLKCLSFWSQLFGERFQALVVLMYWLQSCDDPNVDNPLLRTRTSVQGRVYSPLAIRLADFVERGKPRSPRWDVVGMSAGELTRAAEPFDRFLE